MGRKSKHKSKIKPKTQNTVQQCPLKSSWTAAIISFLKEFYLNFGDSMIRCNYEENLNDEGIRKKDLIWGPVFLIVSVYLACLPFFRWEVFADESAAMRIFLILVFEAVAVGMGIGGILIVKNAIKKKSNKKNQRK